MSKKAIISLFTLLLVLMCVSCEVRRPKGIIAPEVLEAILYDYHLAQIMANDATGLQYKKKLYAEYVFKKHGCTQAEFDSSMVWYARNPKHMYDVYASLCNRIDAELAMMEQEELVAASLTAIPMEGDTVDLWNGIRIELLSATPYKNKLYFECDADSTFVTGDSIVLSMNSRFIACDSTVTQQAYMAMLLEYEDSASVSNGYNVVDGAHTLTFNRDSERAIKSIRAFVYYTDDDSLCSSRLLLGNIKLLRIHPPKKEK